MIQDLANKVSNCKCNSINYSYIFGKKNCLCHLDAYPIYAQKADATLLIIHIKNIDIYFCLFDEIIFLLFLLSCFGKKFLYTKCQLNISISIPYCHLFLHLFSFSTQNIKWKCNTTLKGKVCMRKVNKIHIIYHTT